MHWNMGLFNSYSGMEEKNRRPLMYYSSHAFLLLQAHAENTLQFYNYYIRETGSVLFMKKNNLVWGLILLAAGVFSGLSAFGVVTGSSFLLIVSAGFFIAYFAGQRNLGFLIPACIIASIGLFDVVEQNLPQAEGSWFFLFLSAAFLAVFFIHTIRIKSLEWGTRYWPLFPAISLLLIGGLVLMIEHEFLGINPEHLGLVMPVVLIIIGAAMLLKGKSK